MLLGLGVFADRSDVDSVSYVGTGQTIVSSICSNANNSVDKEILVYTSGDGLLSFSNKKYSTLDIEDKREFMKVALNTTKSSSLGSQVKNKVYNFIADQDSTASSAIKFLSTDASADFAEAGAWFKPFGSAFGVFLGFLSLLIFIFLASSVVMDLAYIGLPIFRIFIGGISKTDKPKFISNEALGSIKESESSSKYKNTVSLYLSRRVPTMLGIALCLGYLISGKIYDIIAYFIDAFTNF